ncbi:hypothetical protein LSAT2_002679, partial [Lamellibrachia satsuma]
MQTLQISRATNCQCFVSPPTLLLILLTRSGDVSTQDQIRRGSTPQDIHVSTAAKVARLAVEQSSVTTANIGSTPNVLMCYPTVHMISCAAVETT